MGTVIGFEQLHNVRDLGGMAAADGRVVKDGLLFRGDQPYFASEADKRKLVELGVRTMVDFRSLAEHEEKPDPDVPSIRNLYLPVIQDVRAGITHGEEENARIGQMLMSGQHVDISFVDDYMGNMYCQFIGDEFANGQYARFVDEVIASAQRGEGIMWHCTAGKDRAGFATAILLEALGVSRDDIVTDYLLTNECLRDFTAGFIAKVAQRFPDESLQQAIARFFSADASYLAAAYDEADCLYGSMSAYLEQALGIDEAKRARLQDLLLMGE